MSSQQIARTSAHVSSAFHYSCKLLSYCYYSYYPSITRTTINRTSISPAALAYPPKVPIDGGVEPASTPHIAPSRPLTLATRYSLLAKKPEIDPWQDPLVLYSEGKQAQASGSGERRLSKRVRDKENGLLRGVLYKPPCPCPCLSMLCPATNQALISACALPTRQNLATLQKYTINHIKMPLR